MKKVMVYFVLILFVGACNSSVSKDIVEFSEPLPETEGELLYLDMKCPTCHGYQGSGDGFLSAGLQPRPVDFSSSDSMSSISDDQLKEAIRNGKGKGMPRFAEFTDHQVDSLVQYIRSLSKSPSN